MLHEVVPRNQEEQVNTSSNEIVQNEIPCSSQFSEQAWA